jgi:hypothetical protein
MLHVEGFLTAVRAMINADHRLVQEHDTMSTPSVTVEAYAGYKGEETPRAFTLDGVRLSVNKILDHWYRVTHSCFRVHARDSRRYVLRYHLDDGVWELVIQERGTEKQEGPPRGGPSRLPMKQMMRYPTFTSIAFGFTFSVLGKCRFNTPSLYSALTPLSSTDSGNEKLLTKLPYDRSTR